MSEQTPSMPTGEHAPVLNEPDEVGLVEEEELSDPPSEGVDAQANPVSKQGIEVVPGYTPILTEVGRLSDVPESAAAAKSQKEIVDQVAGLLIAPDTHGLPDIGEASFGPTPALEVVLGIDDRTQIMGTSAYPWRVHASLLITAADNSQWIGTGWFIGPHTLITAGHCVFIKNSGVPGRDGWVKKITVMPGRNGSVLPYGSVISMSFRSVVGWTDERRPELRLRRDPDPDAPWATRRAGSASASGRTPSWSLRRATSPDTRETSRPAPSGTHARKIVSVNSRKVFYDIDTAGGQSGSAVYRIINGARYGIAIHAYGGATANSGTRIVTPVRNNMLLWKA